MFLVFFGRFFSLFSATRPTRRPSGAGPWPRSERRDDVVFSLRNAALPSNGRLRCGRTSECRFGKARLVPLWAALGQREQRSSTAPGTLRSLRRHSKEPRHCFTVNFLIPCCSFFFSSRYRMIEHLQGRAIIIVLEKKNNKKKARSAAGSGERQGAMESRPRARPRGLRAFLAEPGRALAAER